jgi:membrane fusion protein, multidrug efflux system
VAVVNADGKAEIRAVELGPVYGQMIVVKGGVKAGEKVIVEGFQKVRQGIEVSAKPYTKMPKSEGSKETSEKKPTSGES